MITVDVNTLIGGHPHRHVPHPEPQILARVLAREHVPRAWVGHLPSAFEPAVADGNEVLYTELAPYRAMLSPTPCVRPDRPAWEAELARCLAEGAAAVRAYPAHWGMRPGDRALTELAAACAESELPLMLTVRFEDPARRDWPGAPPDLDSATIARLAQDATRVRLIVTAASGALVEATFALLTPRDRSRVWWDISWIAGPPRDDLARVLTRFGSGRFLYGSQWPLRLTQTPRANLDLLPDALRAPKLADADALRGA